MDDSALFPPNHHVMSDTVIADVIQRIATVSYTSSAPSNANALQFSLPSVHLVATSNTANGRFRPRLTVHQNPRTAKRSAGFIDDTDEDELRRQRNRMHQARFKMKQRKKMEELEISIEKLQEEIQELKLQREAIAAGVMTETTVWNVVTDYFRMFRYGVRTSELANPSSALVGQHSSLRPEVQRNFLMATMASSVSSEAGYGVDALMESWSFVSKIHPDIDIQLMNLESDVDGFVVGRMCGTLTITENTLRYAFPHLIKDGEDREQAQLADKLLGQQLVMRRSIQFEWDNDKRRIVGVQHRADLLTPLLSLLGNLEDVFRVFDNALVTPDCTSVAWGSQ